MCAEKAVGFCQLFSEIDYFLDAFQDSYDPPPYGYGRISWSFRIFMLNLDNHRGRRNNPTPFILAWPAP